LWVKDHGFLQASGQTEYHKWEMNYPDAPDALTITPRIEFADSDVYYTNLYEFDSHMEIAERDGAYVVETRGELKDRNRWEGGVAYVLTHTFTDDTIEKNVKLRFHGRKPALKIVEPFIENRDTRFVKLNDRTVEILGGRREFVFELLSDGYPIEIGTEKEKYKQPFPALKGYPITLNVAPDPDSFIQNVRYKISIRNH
jgi:hypothetical protein